MGEGGSVEARVREVAERAALERGLELVHVELAGGARSPIVRVFIDKPGGVTHEDCSAVSNHVGTILDVEDFIHSAYTLEVSSPGLERGLYKRADYERFAGQLARLKARQLVNAQLPRSHSRLRRRRRFVRRQDNGARPRPLLRDREGESGD